MPRRRGFTLVEIVITIFILMLLLTVAVPSLTGVMADRRLRRTVDDFTNLARTAQTRSVAEHRNYLVVQDRQSLVVRPEAFGKEEKPFTAAELQLDRDAALKFSFPAALRRDPPPQWIFWPTGTCEPATVVYTGRTGHWSASFSPLSGRASLTSYAAR
jgi:type II secretory pathway pseudopilin PulG